MTRISIIIPTYNKSEYLHETISSVLAQTLTPLEIILVDDGSNQGHADEVDHQARTNSLVKLIRHRKNQGVSNARNTGVTVAKGEFVLFLDDDDKLAPEALVQSAKMFTEFPHAEVIVSKGELFSGRSDGTFKRTKKVFEYNREAYAESQISNRGYFLEYSPMIHSMLFRKSLFSRFRFDDRLKYGEDRYLWMQMRKGGVKFLKCDCTTSYYRIGSGSRTSIDDQVTFFDLLLKSDLLETEFEKAYAHTLLSLLYLRNSQLTKANRHVLHALKAKPEVFPIQVGKFLKIRVSS